VVSSPRISIGPAGCCINRDYARRGWRRVTPIGGPGTRELRVRTCIHALHTIARQTTRAEWGAACKGVGEGGWSAHRGWCCGEGRGGVGNGGVRVCRVPDACGKGGIRRMSCLIPSNFITFKTSSPGKDEFHARERARVSFIKQVD
jgi:hypothetical protein